MALKQVLSPVLYIMKMEESVNATMVLQVHFTRWVGACRPSAPRTHWRSHWLTERMPHHKQEDCRAGGGSGEGAHDPQLTRSLSSHRPNGRNRWCAKTPVLPLGWRWGRRVCHVVCAQDPPPVWSNTSEHGGRAPMRASNARPGTQPHAAVHFGGLLAAYGCPREARHMHADQAFVTLWEGAYPPSRVCD